MFIFYEIAFIAGLPLFGHSLAGSTMWLLGSYGVAPAGSVASPLRSRLDMALGISKRHQVLGVGEYNIASRGSDAIFIVD